MLHYSSANVDIREKGLEFRKMTSNIHAVPEVPNLPATAFS